MIDVTEIKNDFWTAWGRLKDTRHDRESSYDLLDNIASLVDGTIKRIFNECSKWSKGFAIGAVGGYARRQMAPRSDIDLIILHKGRLFKRHKEFLNVFTAAIWDLGVQPGIQIKDVREVAQAAMEDDVVRTSFIDNRYLCGSEKVYQEFEKIVNEKILQKGKTEFLHMKIEAHRKRAKKFRESVFKLEPNVKEGAGGIRDLNTIYWISKILYGTDKLEMLIENKILTEEEHNQLIEDSHYLFLVRNELHYYHNRKYDVLNMDAQKEVADSLGYEDSEVSLNVEFFMRDYYKAAKSLSEISDKVITRTLSEITSRKIFSKTVVRDLNNGFAQYGNMLTMKNINAFTDKPKLLLHVFLLAAEKGLKISYPTYDLIRKHLYLIDDDYREKYGSFFLKVISKFPDSSKICIRMAKAGVLQAMIPEFQNIDCRPQFDYYHHYTVDEHTYYALGYVDKLYGAQPPHLQKYQEAYQQVSRKDILALAILLHDIGKGQGKNHSVVGAQMSLDICKRLGMNREETETVANLVEHHLLMSHIAERRDLHSIEDISYFCSFINSEDELRLLYVLTYADINAVGGKVFSEWRNMLLTELYEKSMLVMGDLDLNKEFSELVDRRRQMVADRTSNDEDIADLMAKTDDDYIFSNKVNHLVRYMKMASSVKFADDVLVEIDIVPALNCIQIDVGTFDFFGLLGRIAGALSSLGFNIRWAQIHTFGNNIAVDNILVENIYYNELPKGKVEYITERVKEAVLGTIDIDEALEKAAKTFKKAKSSGRKKNKIEFDNEISSQYTVIDIFTEDTIGLLYNILRAFNNLMINVSTAKISTDADRVVDSFYVTDRLGQKITDEEALEKISRELLDELNKQ